MDLDTNRDGKVSLIEGVTFVQGFLSATFVDVNRLLQTALLIAATAAGIWNATHPAQAVPVPVVATAPPDAPVAAPHDTDAPADTDAPKAPQAGTGGGA